MWSYGPWWLSEGPRAALREPRARAKPLTRVHRLEARPDQRERPRKRWRDAAAGSAKRPGEGTMPLGSRRHPRAAAAPRSLSRGHGRLPPRPAAPTGALNQRGPGLSVSFWDWEKEAWFLKFLRVGLYFLLRAILPLQGFSAVGVPIPNSEHSIHCSSPSSDILMQAVIVASWGRCGELPVALRGCGAWEEACLSHLAPECFTLPSCAFG